MKQILTNFGLLLLVAVPLTFSSVAFAADPPRDSGVANNPAPSCGNSTDPKGQVLQGVGGTGTDCSDAGVTGLLGGIVNILSIIIGAVSIIMILVSGFKYITSGGDSGKVGSAKNTLIYALIGIAVAVLAQALVNFAFTTAKNAPNPTPSSSERAADGAGSVGGAAGNAAGGSD